MTLSEETTCSILNDDHQSKLNNDLHDEQHEDEDFINLPKETPKKTIEEAAYNKLDNWKSVKLNLAVIGKPSKDKSLFIDQLREDYTNDHSAQQQQKFHKRDTIAAFPCPCPKNDNYVIWDLDAPDLKSETEKEEFLKQIANNSIFDYFVLCCHTDKLSDTDIWVAKQLEEHNKSFCVVNLNIDKLIEKYTEEAKEKKPSIQLQEEIADRVKNDLRKELEKAKVITNNIFAISSNLNKPGSSFKWDLPKFYTNLMNQLDSSKINAFVYSIGPWAKDVIMKKTALLKNRIYYVAIINCICGAFLPELAITVDLLFLSREIWFYLDQLGLSKKYLKYFAETRGNVYPKVKSILVRSKYESFFSSDNIRDISELVMRYLPLFVVSTNAAALTRFLPFLGPVVGGAATFLTTKYALSSFLDEFQSVAIKLNELISSIPKTDEEELGEDENKKEAKKKQIIESVI